MFARALAPQHCRILHLILLTLINIKTSKILFKTGIFYELYQYKTPINIAPKFRLTNTEKKHRDPTDHIDPKSAKVSTSRAKAKLRRLVLGNMWEDRRHTLKFLTLTFADEVTDLDFANYELQKFRQTMSYHIKEKLNYIAVPEIQKKRLQQTGKAVWHYHLLTFNLPYKTTEEIAKMWGNGFVDPRKVNRAEGAVNYLSKYLSKAYGDKRLKNRKRYYNALQQQTKKIHDPEMILSQYQQFFPMSRKVTEFPIFGLNTDGAKTEIGRKTEYMCL